MLCLTNLLKRKPAMNQVQYHPNAVARDEASRGLAPVCDALLLVLVLVLLLALAFSGFVRAEEDGSITKAGKDFWSFQPPRRPPVPELAEGETARDPLDHFIVRKQREAGLSMKPEADRRTLIRRLYFDMLGLPPSPDEVRAFVDSEDPEAYGKLVEQVLESPHYGERWGRHWLDVAGWAESSLIVGDAIRPDFWRYRDYVIESFNRDKPFDQFVREQLAGDELADWREADTLTPDMIEKLTATGFLRSAADGTDNQLITQMEKRYDTQQAAVEVATKALLGLTMNCVRCHDHKFDPVTQEDYYRTIAIFQPAYDPAKWVSGNLNTFGAGPVRAIPILDRAGRAEWARRCQQVYDDQAELLYQIDYGIENTFRDRFISEHLEKIEPEERRAKLKKALRHEERKRTPEEKGLVFAVAKELEVNSLGSLRKLYPEMKQQFTTARKSMKKQRGDFNATQPDLIWALWDVSTQPSPATLLTRGDYSKPAHAVEPGVIAVLDSGEHPWAAPGSAPQKNTTGRRLAFARWLTRPDHPLTARVMVNRIWQYHFGTGIVSTPDDFGERGSRPSHPELLDWLAVQFVAEGWSIKQLQRRILHSASYRQESGSEGDPSWLSGFPRRRLEAEIIRDHMLTVSGLLDRTRGGESVPTVKNGPGSWKIDPGHAGRYRRSVYISTQRSKQPAMLKTFDGPVMETNWPDRAASAVAPQSLILMNHPFVLECATAFAGRIEAHPGDLAERLRFAWRLAFGRDPLARERDLIVPPDSSKSTEPDWEVVAHAILSSNEFLYLD